MKKGDKTQWSEPTRVKKTPIGHASIMLHGDPEPSMAPNIVEEVLDFRLINFTGTTYLRIGTQNAPKLLGPHMLMTSNAEVLDFGPFIFNERT